MKKQQSKSTYYELLRDPRWQKKRLEVMEADRFACRACGDTTSTLNVHHLVYRKGAMPWDYEPGSLTTLCESCHKHCEDMKEVANRWIASVPPAISREALESLREVTIGMPKSALDSQSVLMEAFKCRFYENIMSGFVAFVKEDK
jgi:hypothetical protein